MQMFILWEELSKNVWRKLKWFFNTYKFCNHNINNFILLSWKSVYPYKYIDDWEKIYDLKNKNFTVT